MICYEKNQAVLSSAPLFFVVLFSISLRILLQNTERGKDDMSRVLIIIGLMLLALGLFWPWLKHIPLGRLPGDIIVQRQNFRLYFPVTSSILISLVLSLLVWFCGGKR